ncbi:ergothioneine biosynthesis protein EgtB [Acidipila rosea]|uniref:Ergothioneine biosynthesis protein EgtB n=1 Tax=Acidipila rosea TaxID=768535 RepID=A0A4R1L3K6_9BACT|nr:ergothioneine biosynthesis protein EgtB [Acidipila rosea]TCK70779.1 ergothioneine biosynthesis protein EgtB [Acidipila rosea]
MNPTPVSLPYSATASLFASVRRQSETLCSPLTPEDMMVQSCPEASPAKWHLAHTAWFFETFVLREFLHGYRPLNEDYLWLFNSYYNAISAQPEKKLRACFSRPSLAEVLRYRSHVDSAILELLEMGAPEEAERRIVLGLNHEQQHQELLLTDIKHSFWMNPLKPVYKLEGPAITGRGAPVREFLVYESGVYATGHSGEGFAFDNELPRHRVWLDSFAIASQPVTCAEYLEFMQDGGYEQPELWLAEGWTAVQEEKWRAPLYWFQEDGEWQLFTLRGTFSVSDLGNSPVCHLSGYEAEAFARWAGKRLPTEAEWETAAATQPTHGNLLESGALHPVANAGTFFGNTWEWTASAYLGYPGYRALPGALGEYNGKFMSNQTVLRGGSCVTPASHIRPTYRNFFPSRTRWQFSGLRLCLTQE